MSKNHPNDNIYSILGKLAALQPTPQEKHNATVQQIRESVESQGSILKGLREVGEVEQRLAKSFAESKIEEKAVSQAQQKFMGMVHAAQKGAKAASPEVAKVAKSMGKKDAKDFAATKHKGLPQHVSNETLDGGMGNMGEDAQEAFECAGCAIGECSVHSVMEDTCNECGMYESECGCDHGNKEHMDENGLQRYTGIKKYGKEGFAALQKAGREGASEEEKGRIKDKYLPKKDVSEDEDTHTGGKKVSTKTGTLHKSKSTVDAEHDVMTDKLSDPDKDETPAVSAEKKGRGRPKKAEKDTSQAKMPWGGKPPKDTYKKSAGGWGMKDGRPFGKNAVAESLDLVSQRLIEGLNFKKMAEETHQSIDELMNELQNDINHYKTTGSCSEKLKDFLTVHHHSKKQIADEAAMEASTNQPVVGAAPANLNGIGGRHAPVTPPQRHDSMGQGVTDWIKGRPEQGQTYEEIDPLEEELSKLAELAGIASETKLNKKPDADKDGIPDWADKKPKVAGGDEDRKMSEDDMEEGNAFGKAIRDAKADGVQPGEKVTVGGKEYAVKEANELIAMLRVAGLDTRQIEEALEKASQQDLEDMEAQDREHEIGNDYDEVQEDKIEVADSDDEPMNAPDEEYLSLKASTLNPGEGDNGEKSMYGGRGDNPMTQQPNRPAKPVRSVKEAFAEMEARVSAEYESIKKVK